VSSSENRQALIAFLESVAKPGRRLDGIGDDTDLVQADILDSFALIQTITYLEERYDLDLLALGIDPGDLATIGGALGAIARAGR
jgi:acyl carrier protein